MSVIKFELKEEHIKLLRHLKWSLNDKKVIVGIEQQQNDIDSAEIHPFGGNVLYEEIDLILNGVPPDFDPFNTYEPVVYKPEQIAEWDKLYAELPQALEVILSLNTFELGPYKSRSHDKLWKKI